MSNLVTRILTAVIAGGAVVAGIYFSEIGIFVFCTVVSILGWVELMKIAGNDSTAAKISGIIFGLLTWVILFFFPHFYALLIWALFIPAAGVLMLWEKKVKSPMQSMGTGVLGLLYVFVPFVFLYFLSKDIWGYWQGGWEIQFHALAYKLFLKSDIYIGGKGGEMAPHIAERMQILMGGPEFSPGLPAYNFRIPLGILFLTWITDSMAYFGGKFLGKHKLFERISPKKTWEGTIIGALFCIGLGVLLNYVWPVRWSWIYVAVIISIFTQLGDLVESMLKRSLQIKDSGGLLPGHGGILDRFDGMLITLPLILIFDLFRTIF